MSRRRSFRRGVRQGRFRPLFARVGVFLVLVVAVMLTVRCTRELDPARGEGGLALTWKTEPGVSVAAADSARTWVLDGQDRILVGPVVAPFDAATGSFDISLRVPAGDDRAVRMQLEGAGARGRGVYVEAEARGIAVPAAGTAEALLRLRNAVPRLEPFTGQPGDLQITLHWSSVPGASHYRLYRRPSIGTESFEVVADTVRVFERTDLVRRSREAIGAGSWVGRGAKTRGWSRPDAGMGRRTGAEEVPLSPAALDTTWFHVSAILHGGAVSVVSDSVAVSFGWIEDTPRVLAVLPAGESVGVPDSVAVEIDFDRPMAPSSLGEVSVPSIGNTVTLRVDGTTDLVGLAVNSSSWLDNGRRLRLQPVTPLRRDARYLLQVTTDLCDLDGRPLDQIPSEAGLQGFESRFDTERYDPLRVTAAVPVDGAIGVALRPLLEVWLNRSARPATVNAQTVLLADSAGSAVACTVTLPQESLIRVTPGSPLRFSTRYQLTVTTGVRDLRGRDGESLDQDPALAGAQPFFTSFRTAPQPTGPRVIAVAPADGAGTVPLDQVVRVSFSRPVHVASVTGNLTVLRLPVGAQISGVLALSSADRTEFTFTPTQLERGVSYRVKVAAGGLDPQGNPVGIRDDLGIPFDQDSTAAGYQEFTARFRVEDNPRVSSVEPADGRDHVPIDTLVTLRFSLPVARNSVTSENLALLAGAAPLPLRPLVWSVDSTSVRLQPESSFSFYRPYVVLADTSLRSTRGSRFDQYPTQPGYQPFRSEFLTAADGIPPRVASWTPGDGATGVSVATPVTVRFTKPVNRSSVLSEDNFFLQKHSSDSTLAVTRTVTADSLVATLVPAAPLENDVEYEVTVKKFVEDRFGQQLDQDPVAPFNQDFTGTFRTEIEHVPPRVAAIFPDLSQPGVPVDATVEVTFSEPMRTDGTLTDAFTLTGPGGAEVAGSATPSPDGLRLVFTPAARLRYAVRFDVRVDTIAADLAGNRLDQYLGGASDPFESWFTTARDEVPPSVLAWVPADGAIAVKVTVNPEVAFDEAMATTTLPGALRLLDSLGTPVPIVVEVHDDRHAVLIPADRLRFAERYTLEASDAARDTSGNGLDQDHDMPGPQPSRVSFRTEDFPPRVAAVVPARDSSGVDPGVVVEVRFAAPVDPATVVVPAFAVYPDGSASPVPGTISSLDDALFRYRPNAPLMPDSQFWIRVSAQVTDRAGNPLDQDPATPAPDLFESGFRTGTPPVASAGPGVCDPSDSNRVTIDASASLDPDGSLAGAEVDWGDGSVETIIVPDPPWPAPQHTYACTDARGCNLLDDDGDGSADETGSGGCDESYHIILRVRDNGGLWSADTTGVSFCNLQVLSSTPADGATGVDTLLTAIRLRFTRALDPSLPRPALFCLETVAGDSVTVVRSWEADGFAVVVTPTAPLPAGTVYRLRALPGIQSTDSRVFDQDPCAPGVQSFVAEFQTQLRLLPSPPPPAPSLSPSAGSPAQEGRAGSR